MNESTRINPSTTPVQSDTLAIFSVSPVVRDEDAPAYQQLLDHIAADVRPADILEQIWVHDIAYLVWEITEARRLKARLLQSTAHQGVRRALGGVFLGWDDATKMGERWVARDPVAIEEVNKRLAAAGWTHETIMAQTLVCNLDSVDRIDRMIASAEARRDAALREIDRHRTTLGARSRAASENVEDAQFREIAPKAIEQQGVA